MVVLISRADDEHDPLISRDSITGDDDEEGGTNRIFTSSKQLLIGIFMTMIIFFLLLTTVFFGALYYKSLKPDKSKFPTFPEPSLSFLGKYNKAAVAADNEICSGIGRDILLKGGNAVDSAIAALFCIGIMDTHSAGIGGGHFFTIYNAKEKKCHVIDSRETAPLTANETMYDNRWDQSKNGWLAVAVPGEIHGMYTAYKNFGSGKILWKNLVDPTIELLKDGFPTSHALARALQDNEDWIKMEPTMRDFINPDTGKIFKVGEQIKTRKNLLKTFEMIANATNPIEVFYNSSFTDKLVEEFNENGGIITKEDFVNYKSIIRSDSSVIYTSLKNNRYICGPPPPSGSAVAQAILNIMDGYTFDSISTYNDYTNLFHHFIESSKFAYAARSSLGDMDYLKNASFIAKNITSKEWAKDVRRRITHTTHEDKYYGGNFEIVPEDHGTTHISIIDVDGNAVSVTSTINLILGAKVSSPSSGILWNSEMDDFSLPNYPNYFKIPPSPSNYIKGGKRPMSSMSPIIIFNNGSSSKNSQSTEILAVGGAGGSTIISGVANVALHTMWIKNTTVKMAIDFPRIHNQLRPNVTMIENRMPKEFIEKLEERGHKFEKTENITVITAVKREVDGSITANSDFRKGIESEPAGY
ncbi:Gamma-glutamyltranspeptidase family-containing protein [Strongyloides ratti]|uniref:Gamma-glutamyltranspeptidase family-containing protein n=1 Tax=Strongyloides ratti TaxID=34506 RepID=A0A090L389_STRRB|nr:Gamma-glutamyltranspeptidase family-containing protein [Strongyloides ratti]CEF62587.1 Gamma-glutamyltranspeptidase family-containing protein [Strongyloides ratti]